MVGVLLAVLALAVYGLVMNNRNPQVVGALALVIALDAFLWNGLFVVNPGEAKVLQLFGTTPAAPRFPGCGGGTRCTSERAFQCGSETSKVQG
jgi:hypothetical protein